MKHFKTYCPKNALSVFRRKWGLSQHQIAGLLQVSPSMVGMIEQGRRQLSTTILLQIAELDIKIATTTTAAETITLQHNTADSTKKYKRYCAKLAAKASICLEKAARLKQKLAAMTDRYEKTAAWLQVVSARMKEAGHNKDGLAIWQKQELAAKQTLDKYSLPSRLLLQHTITALEAEAAHHNDKHKQVRQELAEMIGVALE